MIVFKVKVTGKHSLGKNLFEGDIARKALVVDGGIIKSNVPEKK